MPFGEINNDPSKRIPKLERKKIKFLFNVHNMIGCPMSVGKLFSINLPCTFC